MCACRYWRRFCCTLAHLSYTTFSFLFQRCYRGVCGVNWCHIVSVSNWRTISRKFILTSTDEVLIALNVPELSYISEILQKFLFLKLGIHIRICGYVMCLVALDFSVFEYYA